jgi:Relaxase/Mobilisation nuclease domain
MIISGGSRGNWRFFSKHLMNAKDNERVRVVEFRGVGADNVLDAFREMDAVASGTRCKNFFYHADINPREGETLTEEQWTRAVDTLETNLGLDGQPRFVVEHEKEGRVHRHVIWSRIDVDTMTARNDSLTGNTSKLRGR